MDNLGFKHFEKLCNLMRNVLTPKLCEAMRPFQPSLDVLRSCEAAKLGEEPNVATKGTTSISSC